MITLTKGANEQGVNEIFVNFKGRNSRVILDVIRLMLSRSWNRDVSMWSMPYVALPGFLSLISKKAPGEIIIWGTSILKDYVGWKYFRKRQSTFKSLPPKFAFNHYNRYVVTDNYLKPFQTVGVHFMINVHKHFGNKGVLLADTVGLGKTPQSMLAAEIIMKRASMDVTFIICPASIKKKWEKDVKKFLGDGRSIVIDGDKKTRYKLYEEAIMSSGKFVIINYDLAIHDWEDILFPMMEENDFTNNIVIFDEAQYLKNQQAQRTIKCRELAEKCQFTIALSATYIETSVLDVFNIMYVVDNSVLGTSSYRFIGRYVQLDYFGNEKGSINEEELVRKLSPYVLRRQKDKVIEQLPDRMEDVYWVNLSRAQKKCYDDVLEGVTDRINSMTRKEQVSVAMVLTQLGYLIQTCLSPILMDYEEKASAKLELLSELMSSFGKQRVVIFCRYTKMVELINERLKKLGYNTIYAHGGNANTATKKQKIMDQFNDVDNNDIQVLITSDIFKQGVDLVGASVLIHFDLLWNPATMEQRSGRIDRIGQVAQKIYIIYLITKGTIEEEMWNKLYERGVLTTAIVDEGYVEKRIHKKELMSLIKI